MLERSKEGAYDVLVTDRQGLRDHTIAAPNLQRQEAPIKKGQLTRAK